jgi:hypothetical protein
MLRDSVDEKPVALTRLFMVILTTTLQVTCELTGKDRWTHAYSRTRTL